MNNELTPKLNCIIDLMKYLETIGYDKEHPACVEAERIISERLEDRRMSETERLFELSKLLAQIGIIQSKYEALVGGLKDPIPFVGVYTAIDDARGRLSTAIQEAQAEAALPARAVPHDSRLIRHAASATFGDKNDSSGIENSG